ncbi:MAG: hypothetical protein JW944_06390 [Deltaproteobacteria bacterium]|nr:hypothetical protein [Deltaproteobacteria bacterium]
MGEKDSPEFLKAYPDKQNTKLDSCALCHTGGEYKNANNTAVNMGSCQWCHYRYGYEGKGDIKATLNPYGIDYLNGGRNSDAVKSIALKDSDGDGHNNQSEIDAVSFPGNKEDDPLKKTAPSRIYTRAQLKSLPRHTQFLLMSASKAEDFYAEYTGVALETLLKDAGILESATGIRIYSPDGWSQYHPLYPDPDPALYHVYGDYPTAPYHYDQQADKAKGGWCNYGAASDKGYINNSPINVPGGLKLILAYARNGKNMDPGTLSSTNRLDGEGPYRVIVPQKTVCPPDQPSTASNPDLVWPYKSDWDHSAGSSTRSATIIKVEPLPAGTTDIDLLEAGWEYVEEMKIIIYGAIKEK